MSILKGIVRHAEVQSFSLESPQALFAFIVYGGMCQDSLKKPISAGQESRFDFLRGWFTLQNGFTFLTEENEIVDPHL